jgi:hypothetical protein
MVIVVVRLSSAGTRPGCVVNEFDGGELDLESEHPGRGCVSRCVLRVDQQRQRPDRRSCARAEPAAEACRRRR